MSQHLPISMVNIWGGERKEKELIYMIPLFYYVPHDAVNVLLTVEV